MKPINLRPLIYLTIGWFGLQMAMALDATQFQVMLDQRLQDSVGSEFGFQLGSWFIPLGKATLIGLVLSLGPLAGIIVQPLMGWLGDKLSARGISRKLVMQQAVFYSAVYTFLFTLQLSLEALVIAIGLFFISLNVLSVNYRAIITQTSNRKPLVPYKGSISGLIALFSGLGGFALFMLAAVPWRTVIESLMTMLVHITQKQFSQTDAYQWYALLVEINWPAVFATLVLIATFMLVFRFSPTPKNQPQTLPTTPKSPPDPTLLSPWHITFYAMPFLNLLPAVERRLVQVPAQRDIFRLFLVVFAEWIGIQALRAYFILYATKELNIGYEQANLPLAVLTLVTVLAALPIGKLADRFDNRKLWIACLLLFALTCIAGWFWVDSMPAVMVMSVLLGVSFAGMIVLPLALLFKLCPRQSEGTYSGLYNLFMSVPQLYSLFITGWLIDCFGSYRMILAVGAVSVLLAMTLAARIKTST